MKKNSIIFGLILLTFGMMSCRSGEEQSYKNFIGTWGVERIEYWVYNVDYAGQPIAASFEMDTMYEYDVNDPGYGIQMVYNSDKTGEYRDFAIDSMWFKWNETYQEYDMYLAPPDDYDSVIYCPDTTLVYTFKYLYDDESHDLVMKMSNQHTFMMTIAELTDNSLISENVWDYDETTHTEKMEKFFMKKVGAAPKQASKGTHPQHPVSRMTQALFNVEH